MQHVNAQALDNSTTIDNGASAHLDVQQGVVAVEDQVALLVVQDLRHLLAQPAHAAIGFKFGDQHACVHSRYSQGGPLMVTGQGHGRACAAQFALVV